MVTGGLLTPLPDPVASCVLCANEMIRYVDAFVPGWRLRIGVHVGPVAAGVVGERQFSFDIWGHTVNMAFRIQEAGRPGRITLSREAFGRVKPRLAAGLVTSIAGDTPDDQPFVFLPADTPLIPGESPQATHSR